MQFTSARRTGVVLEKRTSVTWAPHLVSVGLGQKPSTTNYLAPISVCFINQLVQVGKATFTKLQDRESDSL
jgi:hypothetical protein